MISKVDNIREREEQVRLKVGVATDNPEARPRFAKGANYVRDASVSPSGSRAVVEFRGEIVTVPAPTAARCAG